jgi:membrane associated rhomboid family serine protease
MDFSITLIIIIVTSAISVSAFSKPELMYRYQFNPYMVVNRKEWYRFFTHGFLHADWMHLIINMLVLYFFGSVVEKYFILAFGPVKGIVLFVILYASSLVAASVTTFEKHKQNHYYNAVGASGAVSAILFSSIVFNPWMKIYLYGIIGLPGIAWALIYVGYCVYMGKKGQDNINHEAHLWGAIFGFVFTIAFKPSLFLHFIDQLKGFQ